MRGFSLAILASLALAVVFTMGGAARAEEPNIERYLTPPMMERIVSVLTMDGRATEDQYRARVNALLLWLANHADELKGNPGQALDQALASPEVANAGQGEVVIAGSSTGGNVPPCVAQHQYDLWNCSNYTDKNMKTYCLQRALSSFSMCVFWEGCWNYGSGDAARAELKGCADPTVPPCKNKVGYGYTIGVMSETVPRTSSIHLLGSNYPTTWGPPGGNAIQIRVYHQGKLVIDTGPVLDNQAFDVAGIISVPPKANPGNQDMFITTSLGVEVTLAPPLGNGLNDYTWGYVLKCR